MEDSRAIILPLETAGGDNLGLRLILEFFAECTGTRWVELAIRSRRWDRERIVTASKPTRASVTIEMNIDDDTGAVLTLVGSHPPTRRVLDLLASNIGRELEGLRRQAEASLLKSATNSADAAIMIFGASGNILFANRLADALISKQTEEELTVGWKTQDSQPLFRLLFTKVGEILDGTGGESWRDWVEVSDGSALTIDMVDLSGDGVDFGPAVMAILREAAGPPDERVKEFATQHRLSPRERDVLRLLVRGYDTAGLAERLGISPHTVRDHLKNVFRKTSNRSRSELLSALARVGNHGR